MIEMVERILNEGLGLLTPIKEIIKLHGDASSRTYSRILLADGRHFIMMQMPEGRASASEEITNFKGKLTEPSFINVARFLTSRGLTVPEVHYWSERDRVILLEDVGDEIMAKHVIQGEANQQHWYEKAVNLLVKLQKVTHDAKPTECIALRRSFDATLLNWEFDHFFEFGLGARKISVSPNDAKLFYNETRSLTEEIITFPTAFTHRDFQSRNLMIRAKELVLIDFQDALIGPAVYDLVSLTRDSYINLPDTLLTTLLDRYAHAIGAHPTTVRHQHRLVTVQRKLKDAGRFVYIDRVKKNPSFLRYIPTSLGYVRWALEELPKYERLYGMLKRYIPEWVVQ